MERCLVSHTVRELQIKIAMRYHCFSTRMAKIKKKMIIPNTGEDTKQQKLLFTVGEKARWYSHFEKQIGSFL